MSRDTWAAARERVPVEALLAEIRPHLREADGVTISGGEPFDQADALLELVGGIRASGDTSILVYSGFSFEPLAEQHKDILSAIDILISEPFDASAATRSPLRGSSNQRVHRLTSKGSELWVAAEADWRTHGARLDVIADPDGRIWIAGVPGPGDLGALSGRLGDAGILGRTSAGRLGATE
jgi:anaerobic ribonucleoside-triphosphate reductase activating protein